MEQTGARSKIVSQARLPLSLNNKKLKLIIASGARQCKGNWKALRVNVVETRWKREGSTYPTLISSADYEPPRRPRIRDDLSFLEESTRQVIRSRSHPEAARSSRLTAEQLFPDLSRHSGGLSWRPSGRELASLVF